MATWVVVLGGGLDLVDQGGQLGAHRVLKHLHLRLLRLLLVLRVLASVGSGWLALPEVVVDLRRAAAVAVH